MSYPHDVDPRAAQLAAKDRKIAALTEALEWYAADSDEKFQIVDSKGGAIASFSSFTSRAKAALANSPAPDPAEAMRAKYEAIIGERDRQYEYNVGQIVKQAELEAQIVDLKEWVITFLGPYAAQYSADYGLDGLYPSHYDMLEKCGARMVEFKRAALKGNGEGL